MRLKVSVELLVQRLDGRRPLLAWRTLLRMRIASLKSTSQLVELSSEPQRPAEARRTPPSYGRLSACALPCAGLSRSITAPMVRLAVADELLIC